MHIITNIWTAFLATDEIHQLRRLRLEGIPESLSRSCWLVCQRVAVVCYNMHSAGSYFIL